MATRKEANDIMLSLLSQATNKSRVDGSTGKRYYPSSENLRSGGDANPTTKRGFERMAYDVFRPNYENSQNPVLDVSQIPDYSKKTNDLRAAIESASDWYAEAPNYGTYTGKFLSDKKKPPKLHTTTDKDGRRRFVTDTNY